LLSNSARFVAYAAQHMRRITPHRSKQEDEFAGQDFDYVLTVRQREGELPGVLRQGPATASRLQRSGRLRGSEKERLDEFRRVRDELRSYLNSFAKLSGTCADPKKILYRFCTRTLLLVLLTTSTTL
jgi:protein-tyrosine-phosphatase